MTHTNEKKKEAERLDGRLKNHAFQISQRLTQKLQEQAESMRSIATFAALQTQLTPHNFESYSREFMSEDSGWLMIEWQPIIPSNEREKFEKYVATQFFADFRLWELDENNQPIVAKQRSEHTPVLFIVTNIETANTIGLDLSWSEERMLSKWEARDSGNAQLSGFFDVVLSEDTSQVPKGFAITVPVFKTGNVPETLPLRKQLVIGYIAGVFDLRGFLHQELQQLQQQGINFKIADREANSGMYIHNRSPVTPSDQESAFTTKISALGQEWVVTLTATQQFSNTNLLRNSVVFPSLIMLLWLFISIGFAWIYRQNKQLVHAQKELNKALENVQQSERHYLQLSRHDSLTGLLNRRAFIEGLDVEINRTKRYREPLCLLMADIDEFKKVNDTYGHLTGDTVLKEFASICLNWCREQDLVCRFGGEEFAVLMLKTDIEEGMAVSLRLLEQVSAKKIKDPESDAIISVTFSAGIASVQPNDNVNSLIARVDKALYNSKHNGRNQISTC